MDKMTIGLWIAGIAVAVIGYFLKGIHDQIKNVSEALNKTITAHAVTENKVINLEKRVDKLEM